MKEKVAVYPGSFDPITYGHLDILQRGLRLFDTVICAIATNIEKNSLFTVPERMELIRESINGDKNVVIDSFDGLLVQYVKRVNARFVIRGLRAMSDFEYEFQMASMNRNLNCDMDTIFMMTSKDYFFVSSRTIKEVASFGGVVKGFVPPAVEEALNREVPTSMKKIFCILLFVLLGCSFAANGAAKDVYQISVQGVIGPPIAQFIVESLKKATDADAEALLILLDTPGGLDTSMREIIKAIMDSKIPVIVYVYPQGARAASAGSIILLAAHVAAMAPGTNAGAAHPVSIGKDEKPDKVMMKKVVQDAEAYAKSIAKKRGRNVDWAGKAVTQSVSATAEDALRMHVIDLVAATVRRSAHQN